MILDKIRNSLGEKGFQLAEDGTLVYCPHVNGLTTYCLAAAGYSNLAKEGMRRYSTSDAFNIESNLFFKTVTDNGIVDETHNSCKDVISALGLVKTGSVTYAHKVLGGIEKSPLKRDDGLLNREYLDDDMNQNVYPQTQFWYALLLQELGKTEDAKSVLAQSERLKDETGLFPSNDCRMRINDNSRYYLDDQALYAWAHVAVGNTDLAKTHLATIFNYGFGDIRTGLYKSYLSKDGDSQDVSTYKNSLLAIALAKTNQYEEAQNICDLLQEILGSVEEDFLMESTATYRFAPDNNALYLYANALAESHKL